MIAGKEEAVELRASAMDIVLRLQMAGYEAFFVGGCVRDFVRGVETRRLRHRHVCPTR